MTALLPARRRAEAFAGQVDALVAGDRVARSDATGDGRFDTLLDVVSDLVTASGAEVEPRASFTAELRTRLMLAADTDLVPTDERLHLPPTDRHGERRRRSRLATAATTLAVVAGTAGVAVASSHSVPGEPLHPVKVGVEQVRSALSFGDAAQGRTMLSRADARLDEIDRMLDGAGDRSRLPDTIDDFTTEASQGTRLLFRAYNTDGDTSSVGSVTEFVHSAMGRLATIADDGAPASIDPRLDAAAQALSDADQEARTLCIVCATGARVQAPAGLGLASGSTSVPLDPVSVRTEAATLPSSSATSGPTRHATGGGGGETSPPAPSAAGSARNAQLTDLLLGIIDDGRQSAPSGRPGDPIAKTLTKGSTEAANKAHKKLEKALKNGEKDLRDATGNPLGDILSPSGSGG